MTATRVADDERALDARLTAEVAGACVVAFAVFVLPSAVAGFAPPFGLEGVWALGGLLTIVLGPVVAGLCGFVSLAALWMHGAVLSTATRRLHLVALLLVAALWLGFVSTWGSGVMSWWLD